MIVVLMGVSGVGKTTIGELVAQDLHAEFADADSFHSPENKQKMHAGIPLTDEDRQPWLASLNALLRRWHQAGQSGVLACSALKQSYRAELESGLPPGTVRIVLLDGSPELIADRLAHRKGHYMNPDLLKSQFDALERPVHAICVVNDRPPEEVANEIVGQLQLRG